MHSNTELWGKRVPITRYTASSYRILHMHVHAEGEYVLTIITNIPFSWCLHIRNSSCENRKSERTNQRRKVSCRQWRCLTPRTSSSSSQPHNDQMEQSSVDWQNMFFWCAASRSDIPYKEWVVLLSGLIFNEKSYISLKQENKIYLCCFQKQEWVFGFKIKPGYQCLY